MGRITDSLYLEAILLIVLIAQTYNIIGMRKKQAEEYFTQLKKIDRDGNIKLADLINILTGGTISVKQYESFLEQLKSNEFGQFNYIDENIDKKDWRTLQFSQIYELLNAIKGFVAKRAMERKRDMSEIIKKEFHIETTSENKSSTVVQLLNSLTQIEDPFIKRMNEQRYEQKYKKGKVKILKKLLIVFDYYRKAMCLKDETFDKNQKMIQHLNITMFMRYSKEFGLSSAFELANIIKYYKKHAINTIWIDFDRFVSIHYDLIDFIESLSNEEKYIKLKGLNDFFSSQKMKKILNTRNDLATSTIVVGHTGVCQEDVLKHLQEKSKERMEKIQQKWSFKSLSHKDSPRKRNLTEPKEEQPQSIKKFKSEKRLERVKTQANSIYDQLRLPKLRLKQHRNESVYKCLDHVNVAEQQERLKGVLDLSENQQFLNEYLKEQIKLKQKAKSKQRKIIDLPRMKFS